MKAIKEQVLICMLLATAFTGFTQEFKSNVFVRTPQVVNYNIDQNKVSYQPIVSIGAGLSHQSKFIELATYIGEDDSYGFYSFFGATLTSKELNKGLQLHTNWFGEVTYVPEQNQNLEAFIYTTGLCFVLNHSFEWGSIGIPLCVGPAYSNNTISLNTRIILNLSFYLN